jgi:hypothetical protein
VIYVILTLLTVFYVWVGLHWFSISHEDPEVMPPRVWAAFSPIWPVGLIILVALIIWEVSEGDLFPKVKKTWKKLWKRGE